MSSNLNPILIAIWLCCLPMSSNWEVSNELVLSSSSVGKFLLSSSYEKFLLISCLLKTSLNNSLVRLLWQGSSGMKARMSMVLEGVHCKFSMYPILHYWIHWMSTWRNASPPADHLLMRKSKGVPWSSSPRHRSWCTMSWCGGSDSVALTRSLCNSRTWEGTWGGSLVVIGAEVA